MLRVWNGSPSAKPTHRVKRTPDFSRRHDVCALVPTKALRLGASLEMINTKKTRYAAGYNLDAVPLSWVPI